MQTNLIGTKVTFHTDGPSVTRQLDVTLNKVKTGSIVKTDDGFVKVYAIQRMSVSNGGFYLAGAAYVSEDEAIAAGYTGNAPVIKTRKVAAK